MFEGIDGGEEAETRLFRRVVPELEKDFTRHQTSSLSEAVVWPLLHTFQDSPIQTIMTIVYKADLGFNSPLTTFDMLSAKY